MRRDEQAAADNDRVAEQDGHVGASRQTIIP